MAKRRRAKSNQYRAEGEQRLFSFGPTRRSLFGWSIIAGVGGGLFLINDALVWQIIGFLVIFFISNHHVNKATEFIPRWHAVLVSLAGVLLAMIATVTVGTFVIAYSTAAG